MFKKFFFKHKNTTALQLFLYFFIGIFGFLVDGGIFFLLLKISTPPLIAQWISAMFGAIHNHLWHHYFLFEHTSHFSKTFRPAFILAILTILLSGPMLLIIQSFFNNFLISKILIIIFIGILGFTIKKFWIFRKQKT